VVLAGRVLQGSARALLVPGSLAIVRATFDDPRERAAAIGLWSTSSGVALAVGPVLGGVVVGALGWRWVVLLNVPLCAALMVLAARIVPRRRARRCDGPPRLARRPPRDSRHGGARVRPDRGPRPRLGVPAILTAFVGGPLRSRHSSAGSDACPIPWLTSGCSPVPQLPPPVSGAFVVVFSFFGAIVYLSAKFQQVRALSPIAAGVAVSPIGAVVALAAVLSGRLVGRVGERWPLVAGLAVSGAATLGQLRLGTDTGVGRSGGTSGWSARCCTHGRSSHLACTARCSCRAPRC
jgi:MFS transporter, DHA2 family, methylenomycin A resistance protein